MLNTGIFPSQVKIPKVIPLHKANDKILLPNYRQIALLPSVSKIFENVMLDQISNYFINNNLLSMQQYGFRAKHSTEFAALNLVDHLTNKLDTGLISSNIYIDLSKAFDTLIHDILLNKLNYYGVRGVANRLIYSGIDFNFFFSSFFFFQKNYLLLSCATSVRPSVRPSVCGNNFFSR